MREIMTAQATSCDLKELVQKFIPEMIGKEIEKATLSIYPLQNVFIRKVKILKAPKFDLGKLMEVCLFIVNSLLSFRPYCLNSSIKNLISSCLMHSCIHIVFRLFFSYYSQVITDMILQVYFIYIE